MLSFLVSIGFSQTGNDFLNEYPFGKKVETMGEVEHWQYLIYNSTVEGMVGGNFWTLNHLHRLNVLTPPSPLSLFTKTCGMKTRQLMRIIKKYCDENPEITHTSFKQIVYLALQSLPLKSVEDCSKALNK